MIYSAGSPVPAIHNTVSHHQHIILVQSKPFAFTVHFNMTEEGHPVKQPGDEEPEDVTEEPDKTTEESLVEIRDAQKRDLDQWCFAEHFEPHVLAQVGRKNCAPCQDKP